MSLMTKRRPETALDVLRGARELLAVPERWTQGVHARNEAGQWVLSSDRTACCWCLVGALGRVAGAGASWQLPYVEARLLIAAELGGQNVAAWQDAPERTHAEVLDLLNRTIARAEASE